MGILHGSVGLLDVRDVDGFVGAVISRHPTLSRARGYEREELEAEGLLILCELAREYRPAPGKRFAGYAGEFLPRRLVSAHHRLHRGEHVRRHRGGWDYRVVLSLEGELARPGFSERNLRRVGEFGRAAA